MDVDGRELLELDCTDGRNDGMLDDPLIALAGVLLQLIYMGEQRRSLICVMYPVPGPRWFDMTGLKSVILDSR